MAASVHFKKHLIHRCIVQRTTQTLDAGGGIIDSWADVATIDCRFVEKTERIALESTGFQMLEEHLLLCSDDEDVIEEDRISTITFKADGTSVDVGPYSIEKKLIRNTTSPHHMSFKLERVE